MDRRSDDPVPQTTPRGVRRRFAGGLIPSGAAPTRVDRMARQPVSFAQKDTVVSYSQKLWNGVSEVAYLSG